MLPSLPSMTPALGHAFLTERTPTPRAKHSKPLCPVPHPRTSLDHVVTSQYKEEIIRVVDKEMKEKIEELEKQLSK